MHHRQAVAEGSTQRGLQRKLQSVRTDNRAASPQTSPDSDTSAVVPLRNHTVRPLLLPRIDRSPELTIQRTASEPLGGHLRAQLSHTHSCLNQRRSAAQPIQVTTVQELTGEQRTNVSKVAKFSLASSALRVAAKLEGPRPALRAPAARSRRHRRSSRRCRRPRSGSRSVLATNCSTARPRPRSARSRVGSQCPAQSICSVSVCNTRTKGKGNNAARWLSRCRRSCKMTTGWSRRERLRTC